MNCALCTTELKFSNTPIAGGYLKNGDRICRFCAKKLNSKNPGMLFNLNQYAIGDVKAVLKDVNLNDVSKKPNLKAAIFIGIILVAIIAYSLSGTNKDIPLTASQIDSVYDSSNKSMAKIMARDFVKQLLKSPTSAEFDNEKTWYLKDSVFMVKGTVDSQNSFGAILRANYECKVKQVDKNNWIVLDRNLIQ